MTYYKRVADKLAIKISDEAYSQDMQNFLIYCCQFHECEPMSYHRNYTKFCFEKGDVLKAQLKALKPGVKPYTAFRVNHYARSLEKYELKGRTWKTANRESGYDILGYLERAVGWEMDPIALRYSCQVRAHLRDVTGEEVYLRPGDAWLRNLEFGRNMTHADKGRRKQRANEGGASGMMKRLTSPYHYHGHYVNL